MKKFAWLFLFVGAVLLRGEDLKSSPLKAGDRIPEVSLRTEDDKNIRLRETVAQKPAVLIFYRGGWCPFCTRHLQNLGKIENDLKAAGVQLLAISMDQPSKLRETPNRDKLGYQLLSDSAAEAIKAFGIAFRIEDSVFQKYKDSYQIDLEAISGEKHHLLPHPSVFVVDQSGIIRFAHVNRDYQVRLEPEKVLEAARQVARGK